MKTKKTLITVISFMLAMIFLIPVTAFAENSPTKDSHAAIYLQSFDEHYTIYSANQDTDSVEGVVYDEATNTLILTYYKRADISLICAGVGDDFKLMLVGDNELSSISIWGDVFDSNLTITGTGSLVVNENKESISAIFLLANRSGGNLNIQNGVTVKLYSKDEDSSVLTISASSKFDINSIIVINGNVAEDYSITEFKRDEPIYKYVAAYDASPGWQYPAFAKENDSATYVGNELYDDDTFELTGMFNMYKVEYCEQLGMYLTIPVEGMANIDPAEKGFTANGSNIENIVLVDPNYQMNYEYYKDKSGNEFLIDTDGNGAFKRNLVTIDGYGVFVTKGEYIDNFDELEAVIDGYQPAYYYSINVPTLTITPSSAKYGDCNNDNGINAKDVLILKQHLAKWTVDINMTNADCNGDSAVNAKDLLRLRQYLANWGVPLGRA